MSEKIKLLPCPCGAEAAFRKWGPTDSSTGWGEITCCNDNCTWQVDAKSEAAAVEMWNKREGQPQSDQSKREEFAFWEKALLAAMSRYTDAYNESVASIASADRALANWRAKKKEMGL